MDEARGETLVDLAAQAAHVDLDDVRLRVEIQIPDILEQHVARDDAAGIAQQVFEQAEFQRPQLDHLRAAADGVAEQIELEIGELQRGGVRLGIAPMQRLEARGQLDERKGLGEIVVGAVLQAADAVVDIAECAQHQHRRGLAALAQRLQHLDAVHFRQHAVEDDGVERLLRRVEARASVGGDFHGVAVARQALNQEVAHFRIVLDDQDFHCAVDALPTRLLSKCEE